MSEEVLESVKKCVGVIKGAKNDTEKFAALFLVTKTVKAEKCNARSKLALFEAIEFKFIKRLLLSDEVPAGCPPFVYKSVAMSILSALCNVEEVATHQEILQNVSVFLEIVLSGSDDEDEEDEDNLMLINEAYKCLNFIAQYEKGTKALLDAGTVGKMCEVYSVKSFQTDEALALLVTIVQKHGPSSWDSNIKNFNSLINVLAVDFETDHSERKFKLCVLLSSLLINCPLEIGPNSCDSEIWPSKIFVGLRDILMSKIVKAQRDPALKLAQHMLTIFGVDWSLQDETKPKAFFLLLIHLAAIEIRMHLEDKKFTDQILEAENLLTPCFTILEISLAYLATDVLDLEEKEKQQTYTALKGAFSAVLNVLKALSVSKKPLETKVKCFICVMLMSLSAWLAQETASMRPAVNNILPFALQIANESFYAYRARYISENVKPNPTLVTDDPLSSVDVLRAFLPALCHIAVDDKGREVLIKTKQDEVLYECLAFHWSIAHYKKPVIPKSERLKPRGPEPEIPEARLKKMADSRGAIISLCNTFMNMCVLEGDFVKGSPLFLTLMKFIFDNLPELKNNHENLVMYGNLAVLGLLLLKLKSTYIKKNDFSICRYIQSTIRFLWDAYSLDENSSSSSRYTSGQLVVTMTYKESWMELQELWFLGMQNLSGILTLVPWISEFAIESGWAEGIIEMLVKIKPNTLPTNVKYAYEDLLCRLIEANSELVAVLKKKDAITACRAHKFMELGKKLFGE
ncbi:neurochondrin homolog [Daktulosphaira vitifoliae]|uniref:neurochondrin homolog n=1 Tax=Daktulosphaira vitifoliae TaxID=58002 RepID=UPI0021AAE144|nr:neurochondrin homolog [Daktulosphaira vitifoliae]